MAETWTFKIEQIVKTGEQVQVVINVFVDGKLYAGREISLDYKTIESLTVDEIRDLLISHASTIKTQDASDVELKKRIDRLLVEVIAIP